MKILLTGADGFTGRHFAELAVAEGHSVIPLNADLRDKQAVSAQVAASTPDAVVHLAAISFVGHEYPQAFYEVNLFGTLNLLEALAGAGLNPKTLLVSTANVYGNSPSSPIAETQVPAPVNHYAMSKLAMEFMTRQYADQFPIILARPFNYIGPGQHASFVVPKLVEHFVRRDSVIELGKLDVRREFNDVRFVCAAYLHLLASASKSDTYNICTGQTYDVAHLLKCLETITGHSIEVHMNPHLLRSSEIQELCGNPAKLEGAVGRLPAPELQSTLAGMVEDCRRRNNVAT